MKLLNKELDPLHRLILAYAKPADSSRYALLFALDSRFAQIIRSTSEPLIGQMRLTWWRDILTKPAEERPAGEPLVELLISPLESTGRFGHEPLAGNDARWLGNACCRISRGMTGSWSNYSNCTRRRLLFAFGNGPAIRSLSDGMFRNRTPGPGHMWDFARHCSDDAEMRTAPPWKSLQ